MNVTLISGASAGIGEGFARRLAKEGRDLVLVARSEKALHELCDELMLKHGITAHYIVADLCEHDAPQRVMDEIAEHAMTVDTLINNAGFGSAGDFATLDRERELAMIDLNIRALVELTHRCLEGMRERQRGTIVNVSSAAGFQPLPFMATYAATKSFVSSFSEAVAEENRPFGIQVLALCPGSTDTNFFSAAKMDRAIQVKGQQTVEQVIDTAMNALASGRTKVVSGFANKIGAMMGKYVPNVISRRAVARILAPRYRQQ